MAGLHHFNYVRPCLRCNSIAAAADRAAVMQLACFCGLQLRLIVPGQWKAAWTSELDPAEEVTSLAATVLRNIHTGEQAAFELYGSDLVS